MVDNRGSNESEEVFSIASEHCQWSMRQWRRSWADVRRSGRQFGEVLCAQNENIGCQWLIESISTVHISSDLISMVHIAHRKNCSTV
jgi:hypothetical protein